MPAPGDTICGEIVLEQLAPSSLGAEAFQPVFVARDQARDNQLWLTVVDGAFVPTTVGISTFMAGANTLLNMRHPALVRAVLVDREEDYCVVGYEQLPGAEPLADLIVRGGSRRVLARAAVEVARALAFLHRGGLLHGALTPGTVVMWEGVPVLWEYGIASLCDPQVFGPRARTLGGDVVAPEVPTGEPLTPAVDVYAWGAVMAAAASGELGSDGVSAVLEGDVDPGRHGPLLGVVRQALSPTPAQRPRDGVHLLELLQRALASVDPSTDLSEHADDRPSETEGALRELALRYLAEMEDVPGGRSPPASPAASPAAAPPSGGASAPGALGRVALVKKPAKESGGASGRSKPWLSGTPIKEVNRREPSGLHITGPTAKEPDWSHRLPSDAQAQVPKTQGPGLVRGPEPGVSGSDAGMLAAQAKASESSARWVSPKVTASGWLRPAPPSQGVGGLFNERAPMLELDDGVRKRTVLRPGSRPSAPSARPRGAGAGVPAPLPDEQETPPEPLDLSEPAPPPMPRESDDLLGLAEPSVDARETPPDVEVHAPEPEDELPPPPDDELPPPPQDDLPPAPTTAGESLPGRSRPRETFRPPRRPGPHGPSAVIMGLTIATLSGVLAVGATLSASSARGGFDKLLGVGSSDADAEDGEAASDGDDDEVVAKDSPCPNGMIEINAEIDDAPARYCIDRTEYPGIDQPPAIDTDLPHAQKACEARGHTLCSEAQWTRACEGVSQWKYPYGPRREAGRCLVGDASADPGPTGAALHCVTPDGVLDLVGNVSEWTAEGIAMGGSVRSKKSASCSTRQRLRPNTSRPTLGFRCCMVLPAPAG